MNAERNDTIRFSSPNYIFVEWLRIFAAFGIVVFHAYDRQSGLIRSIGYFGLPAFLSIFSALLFERSSLFGSFSMFLRKRGRRLLLPWLFWSCIYLLLALVKTYWVHKPDSFELSIQTFLTGTSIHLWYLPYAFLASILIYGLIRLRPKLGRSFLFLCIAGFLGVLVFSSYVLKHWRLPVPFPQWVFGTPAVFYGLLLMSLYQSLPFRSRLAAGIFLVIGTEILLAALYEMGYSGLCVSYGIACPLVGAVFLVSGENIPTASIALKGGELTYGIYLIHPLLLSFCRFILGEAGSWFVVISVFAISLAFTYILKRTVLRIFV